MRISSCFLIALIFFICSISIFSEDYENHIPMSQEGKELEIHGEEREAFKAYLPEVPSLQPLQFDQKKELDPSYYLIPESGRETQPTETWKEKTLGIKGQIPFEHENKFKIMKIRKHDNFKKIYNKGENTFTFAYIDDRYSIIDPGSIFQKTFRERPNRVKMGTFHLGFDYYLYRGKISFAYGGNLGVGMYSGHGAFIGGDKSKKMRFNLWTVPLDFLFSVECAVWRLASLQVGGGPSIMGLYQNRTDREDGEDGKRRRQLGHGYAGFGRLKISLANILSASAFEIFKEYNITNYYLNLEARHQNYQKFRDEIKITGTSFGIGFSFDFL